MGLAKRSVNYSLLTFIPTNTALSGADRAQQKQARDVPNALVGNNPGIPLTVKSKINGSYSKGVSFNTGL